ncbi:MAG: ABC transporter ATP-binding protein [Thermoflexales bacterium]|nr:ABC transporter ATP-binding protein [Thermoflexales bacterium]MCS7325052.1 ABC transporter ATP-binding protein [Thermoflexales bacterium]MDW8054163.1 ABC transporter ATP-binding protein [Anaerolineae bacterium]MDW8292317.1 ABC transporter ATP-binding protein [Anaerolineae bacterium]
MALLEAENITKVFGGLMAVNSVSLTVEKGSIVSVIGPNGAGKTTFFNVLTGIYKPDGGTIRFDGETITGLRPDQITQRGIARTFQNIRLFGNMTALENVMVGMHSRLRAGVWGAIFQTPQVRQEETRARQRARELLAFVGLERRMDELAKNLPYGDQRRLEIARALATQPKLILLDEPTAGMNPQETAEATELIRRLRDELGITVVLIEHDMRVVMTISERITVLDYGSKIAEGKPEEIRTNPRVIEAYLGRGAALEAQMR